MTTARRQQNHVDTTPYYHCVSRCVRRCFLCGFDEKTQTSYEHRHCWAAADVCHIGAWPISAGLCENSILILHKEPIKKINVPAISGKAGNKSQALLDEQALAAAMAYVDLNPIRAGLAKAPEDSEYTSIKARLDALKREQLTAPSLHPFIGNPTNTIIKGIPLRLHDYLELVEWTGRQIREGKTGYITSSIPPLLERLHIEQHEWLKASV